MWSNDVSFGPPSLDVTAKALDKARTAALNSRRISKRRSEATGDSSQESMGSSQGTKGSSGSGESVYSGTSSQYERMLVDRSRCFIPSPSEAMAAQLPDEVIYTEPVALDVTPESSQESDVSSQQTDQSMDVDMAPLSSVQSVSGDGDIEMASPSDCSNAASSPAMERRYACPLCDSHYSRKSTLKVHMKKHETEIDKQRTTGMTLRSMAKRENMDG